MATTEAQRTERIAPRVGDVERERAADLVGDACAAGLVPLDEVDGRLTAVFTARTATDLQAVTADLPAEWIRERQRTRESARTAGLAGRALRRHVLAYALGMALMLGVWLAAGLSGADWYPWPIWPALGWGIGVAARARAVVPGLRPGAASSGRASSGRAAGCGQMRASRDDRGPLG